MNLPNKISLTRILIVPFMIFAFYTDELFVDFYYGGLLAAVIFLIAALTDFADGYIARKNNIVTTMGKFLDPIADKIIVVCALFLIVEGGLVIMPVGAIFSVLIVSRELIIGGFRQIAAANNIVISADLSGKIKAVFQDIAMVMFLVLKTLKKLLSDVGVLLDIFTVTAYVVFSVAVILTVYSGISYIIKNKSVLRQ
ncbi:MAG: CDP-diacylglycerol--glycerol-3-phosphate 3-phosphatidyltransferase [Clostridia bacterium]|nr:CDP-diacylglycerol--glycerol-3-phosphate 3-phosphatidyltransferase [Clostridia bacterium]